ncbi:transcript variant X1 [Nothobranchius furzeri]|uniref:Transcript variant X1 n=1 Tax=Nothobranchius furzeri TaxID=105023 RepID=A0A9D2XGK3_NOTFU|nr:transcript variant X1 [Nothobranchius furzeri]
MDASEEGIPDKKSKKSCKYLEKWDSRMGLSHAFFKICSCDFSVSHGGRNDVSHHEKSTKHKRWLEAQKHAQTMSAFVTRNTTEADQVMNAEVKMAMLCARNNASITFCDDFHKCVAEMFPDSAIARKHSAGKTKSTQLIKGAIAAELDDELARTCRSQPFSLMCDESNNRRTDEEFVILTRLYDEATLQVATKFMEMPICNVGNAENLYEKLSEALRKRGIPWENLIAFASDNASVMKGRHNSVTSRLKTSQPHVQDLGCICHLAQLASGCAIQAAQVPVEDFLVGIDTHFDKSAKRCEIYKEFVDFTDSDHLQLLRYCSDRRLSLLTCVQRELNQWDALQAYFNSHEEVERSAKTHDLASHPVMKMYLMFLTAALKP